MRIWDINPGYLNRQSLLGEHREIHGLFNVIWLGKTGYSRHPETLRWFGKLSALKLRHDLLAAEMELRGYNHHSPMPDSHDDRIQSDYVDSPFNQFQLLNEKYRKKEPGRIPLPMNTQQLWAQHKYSILSRDPEYYNEIGPMVSKDNSEALFKQLSEVFCQRLWEQPQQGRLTNGLHHMWGYVSSFASSPQPAENLKELMTEIRRLSEKHRKTYLLHSTALGELMVFL